jgi:dCMP deaminase
VPRVNKDAYYMRMAKVAASRGDCLGTHVGTVIVVDDRIVSTGFNGAPDGVTHCSDGGCPRCQAKVAGVIQSGEDLDKCLCVHAEENAILSAARHGIRLSGCDIYTTVQPCLGCVRQIIQVKASRVLYRDQYPLARATRLAYDRLCEESSLTVRRFGRRSRSGGVQMDDALDAYQDESGPAPSQA